MDSFGSFNEWFSSSFPAKLYSFIPQLLAAVVLFAVGIWLGNLSCKLTVKLLERRNVDRSVHHFLSKSVGVFIKIIFAVSALRQLGFDINSLVAALGAAGITAGLGLKDSISQFASGIQILFNKPFNSGDFIEIDGLSGKVKDIRFMNTTLITVDNKTVTIPNNHITSNDIVNYTAQPTRRIDFVFDISYDTDISKAKGVLYRTSRENPYILPEPSPYMGVKEHGPNSIRLTCQVWCRSDDYWNAYYTMQEDVKNAFDKNGIEIPYEQLDVHIKDKGEN